MLLVYNLWSKYSPMHQILHPYHITGEINNHFKKGHRKIKYYLLNVRKHFNVHLNCIWMQFLFLTVLPKYFNSDTICNDTNCMLRSTKRASSNIRYNKKYLQKYV